VIAIGLQPERLMTMATAVRYQALFSEAGGLAEGNDVTVSGIKVGAVTDVALRRGQALVTLTVDGGVELGSDTTAHIRTGTLLGQRVITLETAGTGRLRSSDVIPVSPNATVRVGYQVETVSQLRRGMRVVVARPANLPADTIQVEGYGG